MPTIATVIIAAYQAETFVAQAVRSALDQTLRDIEVIVVDDGSRDDTAAVARAAAGDDARFQLVVRSSNGGVAAARNVGLEMASGRWIAVLDADDTFAPERLEKLIAAAEARDADLLADNITLVGGTRTLAFDIPERFARTAVGAVQFIALDTPGLETLPTGFMKPVMRRAFLERFALRYPEGIVSGEDFDLYLRALMRGARLFMIGESYYRALVRADSLSRANPALNDAALMRSLDGLIVDARDVGRPDAERMLRRRAHDLSAYGEYCRLSDALRRRRVVDGMRSFARLARGSYVWRRLGLAAGRRVRPWVATP